LDQGRGRQSNKKDGMGHGWKTNRDLSGREIDAGQTLSPQWTKRKKKGFRRVLHGVCSEKLENANSLAQ